MEIFETNFIESIKRSPTVTSFCFKKPVGFSFTPGQFAQLIFDTEDLNNKSLNKYLSFSCSPDKDYIEFTKRVSASDFSSSLLALSSGDTVSLKAPMGSCTFNEGYKKITFLVGGIGITPVISILEYIVENKIKIDVSLLYSNCSVDEVSFKQLLDNYVLKHESIKIHYALDCNEGNLEFLDGFIDAEKIKKCIPDFLERNIYIFGPPGMVKAIAQICMDEGVDKTKIIKESFIGY